VVAGRERRDARPDPLDHARPLVAEDARERHPHRAADRDEVGVADTGAGHPHQDLALPRLVELDLLDDRVLPGTPQDGRRDPHTGSVWDAIPPATRAP
jgi:hypothetical protein